MRSQTYIAGPMTGYVEHNYPLFNHVATILRTVDWAVEVVNPAENHNGDRFLPRDEYLRVDLPQVIASDNLVLLPGWQQSPGAVLEVSVAYNLGLPIYEWDVETERPVLIDAEPLLPEQVVPATAPTAPAPEGSKVDDFMSTVNVPPIDMGDGDPTLHSTILTEAQGLVYGDRQAAYSHPMGDFTAMGRISAAILGRWLESEGYAVVEVSDTFFQDHGPCFMPDIPPRVATMLMQSVKLSREAAHPKRDNRVDGAGYWLCTDRAITGD